jgi:hypothetical protein
VLDGAGAPLPLKMLALKASTKMFLDAQKRERRYGEVGSYRERGWGLSDVKRVMGGRDGANMSPVP